MYNKVELVNEGNPFKITFDGREYDVPSGPFEAQETLGNFIKSKAQGWGIKVLVRSHAKAPTVQQIKEDKIVSIKEEVKEEVKEENKKKK